MTVARVMGGVVSEEMRGMPNAWSGVVLPRWLLWAIILGATAFAWFGCGGRAFVPAPHPDAQGEVERRIDGKLDCLHWRDYDCHFYSRLTDEEDIGVHLLLSGGMACPVSNEDATMVKPGDLYPCHWRTARGL